MSKDEAIKRYRQLTAELYQQNLIARDIDGQQSDDVIKARKEIKRIQHDIQYLMERYL
jgi:hypothetical protein